MLLNIQETLWFGLLPVILMGGYIIALIRNIRKYK
jgi:hypothetical protein